MKKTFLPTKQIKRSSITNLVLDIIFLVALSIVSVFLWFLAPVALIVLVLLVFSIIGVVNTSKLMLVVTDEGISGYRQSFGGPRQFNYTYDQMESVKSVNNFGLEIKIKGEEKPFRIGNLEDIQSAIALISERIENKNN